MDIKLLNSQYKDLITKAQEVVNLLNDNVSMGFFNGHYTLDENKNYVYQYYPIPVISIKNHCDIELDFSQITVTTKLSRESALHFDFQKLIFYDFTVFGVKNYLSDYYVDGKIEEIIPHINKTEEQEIGVQFVFTHNDSLAKIINLVNWLAKEGFYY